MVTLVTQHAESVLRITRRLSLCDADAEDAYQRAIEILLNNVGRLDPVRAPAWLRTVARHEALAIRSQRTDGVLREGDDPDDHVATDLTSTEEQVVRVDRFTRAAEALRDLKPDEARALWLRAEGYSYDEIARTNSWTYTKVNRLLAEGRARFLLRYATIESGGACVEWQPVLSAIVDGEVEPQARREAGVHLRSCLGCRATLRELRSSAPSLGMALPAVGLIATSEGSRPEVSGLLRFAEGLWATVHERIATTAVSAQTLADGFGAGKVAAVTASVAALAGGGVVAVEHHGSIAATEPVAEAESPPSAPSVLASPSAPSLPTAAVTQAVSTTAEEAVGDLGDGHRQAAPDKAAGKATASGREPSEFVTAGAAADRHGAPAEFRGSGEFVPQPDAAPPVSPALAGTDAPSAAAGEFSSRRSTDRGEFAP